MPAPNPLHSHAETLANGLRVSLHHAPGLKRSAALLRVVAGSHDVPLAWPGLAHFLEHLLFLGTERFAGDQALMAYVQAQGGQVNASTRERTTDFFFELPPASFSAGLERLSDLLTHPRMNLDDQQREREVLHAEFIAWSQDPVAQAELARFDGLAADHPLRGFHAGNRDTLAVSEPAFQQALKNFHQRFYQAGQMTLCLTGPQALDELKALAEDFDTALRPGQPVPQSTPTALMHSGHRYQQAHPQRLDRVQAFEQLPEASTQALGFLCHWLNDGQPGGLIARLREQQLADSLSASVLYAHGGQALLHIAVQRRAGEQDEVIGQQVADWLSFFKTQAPWLGLREEYATLKQRQHQASGALQRVRLQVDPAVALSEQAVAALQPILQQLGAVDQVSGAWQLPAPNPFLRLPEEAPAAGLIRGQTSAHRGLRTFAQDRTRSRRERSPMQFSQALPESGEQGALYLRWRLPSAAPSGLHRALEQQLVPLREQARQAGVDITFDESANEWLLKLTGLQEPMPSVLEHVLQNLSGAPSTADEPAQTLIPIRQLLKALPAACLGPVERCGAFAWENIHWDGLAVGLAPATQTAITRALSRTPGTPGGDFPAAPSINGQHLWHHSVHDASEHALLLFCPVPSQHLQDQAAWRWLGHLSQTPFYQRLRVELQLGYAVFSGVRQVHGQAGLLFGVQSPGSRESALLAHIETFLSQLPALIQALDDTALDVQRQALADQMQLGNQPLPEAAERLWQAKLAGHSSDELLGLPEAILALDRQALLIAAQRLISAEGGRRCLASAACPGAPWQALD